MPGEEDKDIAAYEFINLADGSYKLTETAPTGYSPVEDVFFAVTNGALTIDGTLPAGVTMDGNKLLLTVQNTPRSDSLTVRKQWLDVNGNPRDYDGTLDLKLVQWVQNVEPRHKVTVRFRYRRNNGWTTAVTREGTGYGDATVNWSWNQSTNSVSSISVTGGDARYDHLGGKNYQLTIPGSDTDVEVFVDVNNSNYDPWTNYGYNNQYNESIGNVQINDTPGLLEGESLTGGTKTITLGTNGIWSHQFTLSGDGMLSDGSTTLPATYNGKNCYYTIDEESVPEGYELKQISTDKEQSGVLTAYNQRTSEDVTVSVRKVWENGTNEDGTPTEHQPSLDVTLSNGRTVTLDAQNQWQATISGLPTL